MFLLVEGLLLSKIPTLVPRGAILINYLLRRSCANPFRHSLNFTGENSTYFMRKTLQDLSDMQDLPDEGFPHRKQVTVLVLAPTDHLLGF